MLFPTKVVYAQIGEESAMLTFFRNAMTIIAGTALIAFTADTNIMLNTIGFLPDKNKKASINVACSQFSVVRSGDGTTAFSGSVTGPKKNGDTGEDIYTADFSTVTEEGSFCLKVDGVGRSPDFLIKKGVYNDAYYAAMRAMYLWRCGCAVSGVYNGTTYKHAACHLQDAYLDYVGGGHVVKASLKGWHDAGDFNKYTVNAGITIGMMLDAWLLFSPIIADMRLDIPESGNALPDFLAEVKWELDWLLTMQLDNGSVSHKVSTLKFCDFIMPEKETTDRFFVPWGSAATADFVAMTAMAARVFKQYDSVFAQTCLNAATKSYTFLAANTANHAADQTGFSTGGYTTTDPDDRLWAAAELWETTGEQKYLTDFETRANTQTVKVEADWDWGTVKNLGMFTYLLSQRSGKSQTLADAVKNRLLVVADSIVTVSGNHGYGRTLGSTYYWGCNGTIARQTMLLQIANRLSPKQNYINVALDAIGFLFGRNNYCRSFVTGMGLNPPKHPHDRRSIADSIVDPWPGYLVGGGWPGAKDWIDIDTNYQTNEIAINWQGGLIFALAGFVNTQTTAVKTPRQGKSHVVPMKRSIKRAAPGSMRMVIPQGESRVYDCAGRLLVSLASGQPRSVDVHGLGLRSGVILIDSR
jgi:endoglucanase